MKYLSKELLIRMVKSFFLYTFAYVGVATLSGFFIFNEEQTEKEIIHNLIFGALLSIFFISVKSEKRKEELSENQI